MDGHLNIWKMNQQRRGGYYVSRWENNNREGEGRERRQSKTGINNSEVGCRREGKIEQRGGGRMKGGRGKRGRTDRITRFPSWGVLMRELKAYWLYLFILPTALRWGVAVFHTGDSERSNTLGTTLWLTERDRQRESVCVRVKEKWGGGACARPVNYLQRYPVETVWSMQGLMNIDQSNMARSCFYYHPAQKTE